MRIIYYTDTYDSKHGGRTHAQEFLRALATHDKIQDVILFPEQKSTSTNEIKAVSFLSIIKRMLNLIIPPKIKIQLRFFVQPDFQDLCNLIKTKNPDLIIIRHSIYFRTYNRLRKKFPNLIIVVEYNVSPFMEGLSKITFVNYWKKKEIQSLLCTNYISSVSGYLKKYLINNNKAFENKVIINPNGVDVSIFKPFPQELRNALRKEMNIPENAIVFGYIGGMESFRRLPEVVEKFAKLREKGFNRIYLMIIGNGADLENVIEMSDKYNSSLKGYIYYNGKWVPYEEIPKWINIFDVGIFPYSNPYGSPQKIFEYAACGLPILGPEVPALKEGTGLELCSVLTKQDGSNFNEAVLGIYNNLGKEKAKAVEKRKLVEQEYTWQANAERILNV